MSLLLFIIGIATYYYLYVSYFEKKNESAESEENVTEVDNCVLTPRQQIGSMFKSFVLSIADPTGANVLDSSKKPNPFLFRAFVDRFKTFEDVVNAMKDSGLGKSRLILGIDFTASNEWQGRSTHKGHSLHNLTSNKSINPYQHVISVLQHTLQGFVDLSEINDVKLPGDKIKVKEGSGIPAFGFGDILTQDHSTFPLRPDGEPCANFDEALFFYKRAAEQRILSGPTSYAPIIHKAIEIVEESNQYHILVIIADGQFVTKGPTAQAILAASHYPLSIVVVGVGDGPWDTLHQFDDWLPNRQFDNFQFVEYEHIIKTARGKNIEAALALHMLMEIPDQYKMVHTLGYISNNSNASKLKTV